MEPIMYLKCFAIALVGALLNAAIYLKNTKSKADKNNVDFSPKRFFQEDWLSIAISLLTICLFLMLLDSVLKIKPSILEYVMFGFAFVGYFSQDIASRFFGAMNKRVNEIIDRKTTASDEMMREKGQEPITK